VVTIGTIAGISEVHREATKCGVAATLETGAAVPAVRSTPTVTTVATTARMSEVEREATKCGIIAALETGAAVAAVRSTPTVTIVATTAGSSEVNYKAVLERSESATEVGRLELVETNKNNTEDC
jgi:hypothetical protein